MYCIFPLSSKRQGENYIQIQIGSLAFSLRVHTLQKKISDKMNMDIPNTVTKDLNNSTELSFVLQGFNSWIVNRLLMKVTFLPSSFSTQLFKMEQSFSSFKYLRPLDKQFLCQSSELDKNIFFLLNVCHFHANCPGTDMCHS